MKEKVLNWMMTGRVGMSSKAMAAHLCGAPCDGSYQHDPDDLNRCLLFLEAVPEARAELPRTTLVHLLRRSEASHRQLNVYLRAAAWSLAVSILANAVVICAAMWWAGNK